MWRYRDLCCLISGRGLLGIEQIHSLAKDKLSLTHPGVVGRHVRVMAQLGLLDREEGSYLLSSAGHALVALGDSGLGRVMSLAERVFFTHALVSRLLLQLNGTLKSIVGSNEDPVEAAVKYGFHVGLITPELASVTESTRDIPRNLQNNFQCVVSWSRQLGLVETHKVAVTPVGQAILSHLSSEDSSSRPYALAAALVCGHAACFPQLDLEKQSDYEIAKSLLSNSYALFERRELGFADIRRIKSYFCVKVMIDSQRICEEPAFDSLVRTFLQDRVIRSGMAGRDGRLTYISL